MTTASQLYYALWHPDGSERIVRGYAETIGFDRPWKRRAFHSVSEARDWLDGVHSSRCEDKIRRLESELERMTAERDELEHLLYKERMDHGCEMRRLKGRIATLECKRADGMVKLTSTVLDMSKHQLEIVRTYDNATSDFCASASARMLGAGE